MTRAPSKIVCLGGPKEAALYFDKVFPIDMATPSLMEGAAEQNPDVDVTSLLANYLPSLDKFDELNLIINSLLESDTVAIKSYVEHSIMAMMAILHRVNREHRAKFGKDYVPFSDLETPDFFTRKYGDLKVFDMLHPNSKAGKERVNKIFSNMIDSAGFSETAIWQSPDFISVFRMEPETIIEENLFYANLSNLNLVNVDKTSWEHIVEFRKDKDARAALSSFRKFFSDQYEGKDSQYILDDLHERIYRYDKETKLWGFETGIKSLSVAFKKESIITSSIGGISTILFGMPLSVVAGSALSITAGSCLLEIGQSIIAKKRSYVDNPTRYLSELKKKFGSSSN